MTSAVLAERVIHRSRVSSVLLVIGAAALTALAAQWEIHLPFTPVPITGQTFAVLLTGAALGATLGAAGQADGLVPRGSTRSVCDVDPAASAAVRPPGGGFADSRSAK